MLIARIVALAFAAAGLFGVVIAWPDGTPISPESVTEAVTLLVTALGSIYAAWRTWRAKQLEARPAGAVVTHGELTELRAKARAHDELRQQGRAAQPMVGPLTVANAHLRAPAPAKASAEPLADRLVPRP